MASKFVAIKCLLLRILIQSVEIFKTEKKIEIQLHDVQHIAQQGNGNTCHCLIVSTTKTQQPQRKGETAHLLDSEDCQVVESQ